MQSDMCKSVRKHLCDAIKHLALVAQDTTSLATHTTFLASCWLARYEEDRPICCMCGVQGWQAEVRLLDV